MANAQPRVDHVVLDTRDDIDAAAEEAVSVDGAGHFLSSYDGSTSETKSGLVYWRTN